MRLPTTCPDVRSLERLMLGQLPQPEADTLGEHLLQCDRCAETVHTLRAEDPLVEAARAGAAKPEDPESDQVESLIEQLVRLEPPCATRELVGGGERPTEEDNPPARDTEDISALLAQPRGPGEIGRLGPYLVLKVLGAGGMGVVFQAEDPQLRRLVALKVMKRDLAASSAHRERFLREAQATAAVEHDHVITIYQVGEQDGIPFLVMPLL